MDMKLSLFDKIVLIGSVLLLAWLLITPGFIFAQPIMVLFIVIFVGIKFIPNTDVQE